MAFLDNSGDIILDAVLTDAGRQRMARGEFKIVKFAFCDEEINYTTYNGNHPSGSAFADLEIMQTPILESFTNNTSLMKTKLISINRNNILYMPIFRLNNKSANSTEVHTASAGFYLSANTNTDNKIEYYQVDGGSATVHIRTNRIFRDTSAWYHIVMQYDSAQSTASDRLKLYVNGVQETSLETSTLSRNSN